MKKKILVLLALLVALMLVFVACKTEPNPEDTTVDTQVTEEPSQDGSDEPDSETPTDDPATKDPGEETTTPEDPSGDPGETTVPEDPTKDPDDDTTKEPEPPVTTEPVTEDPMEPVNVFEAADITTIVGGDPNNLTQDCVTLEDGFLHIVPIGPDPYYYPFAGVDGARYVAIRYRTDATGADMQLYIASTGNGPSNDDTMIRQPVIADGEWHVIIFDTQSLIDAGHYDGEYVSYFRFDALEAGYKLDENGEPYKEANDQWARYSLPEGCSIDVAYIGFFHSPEAVEKYDFEAYPPFAQPGDAGHVNNSFDTFYVNNQMYFPQDGGAGQKLDEINNTLTFGSASELQSIMLRGWIGFGQAIDSFGYYVDNYEFVFNPDFTKPTEDGVKAAGGEFASRFEIHVPLDYLEGDDHFVGFVVKLADGTVVQLRAEITIDLPELPDDITDSFVSDVNANEIGTSIDASDLANFFIPELPLGGCAVEANGEGKVYHQTSISDFYADVNGRYFFKANVVDSNGAGWMFARGYRVVNSDAVIEAFDPNAGIFKINNYYETDSAGAMGGAGIYARLQGGKLFIMVKYYNPETITRVGNKIYTIDAEGTELTLADNGFTVSVLVNGVTYATIDLIGSVTYGDINEVQPKNGFAEKAVITLKNGITETIENTLIADTCEAQIGVVARAGSFKFDAMSVGGFSAIEVPELEIVTPEPPAPVDPDAPVLILTPEFINNQAHSAEPTVANNIASSEIITEGETSFVKLTVNGGDPYVALINLGSYLELPQYMAVSYRTNTEADGQFFIGSGSGWSGQGDSTTVNWNQDGAWNSMVVDLNNAGLSSIQDGIVTYCRFDFFTGQGAEGDYFDIEYVAFFNSAEAAEKYYNKLHGIEDPDEPVIPDEPEIPGYDPDATYQNVDVMMSVGSKGAPFSADKKFGHRVNIGDNLLKSIFVQEMATYDDGNVNTFTVKVWQWNGDYAATVAAEPLFVYNGENHVNCTSLTVGVPVTLGIHGDIYYEIEYLTGAAQFTGWTASEGAAAGVETYVGGNLTDGSYIAYLTVAQKVEGELMDTHNFQSNASAIDTSNGNVTFPSTDLPGAFVVHLGQGDVGNAYLGTNGLYTMSGFNAVYTTANGAYAFTFKNFQTTGHAGFTGIIVRGIMNAGPEKNYYGADGNDGAANSFGGGGIYLCIKDGKLRINVKTYVDGAIVPAIYETPVDGNDISIVDNGSVISVIVGDKLVATIVLNGTADYGIASVGPETSAASAVLTLADGTVYEIGNVLAAATMLDGNLGFATRGPGALTFEAVSLMPANTVTVPEFPHIHNHEAVVTAPTCTENGYTTYTCACGDTYTSDEVAALGHTFVDGVCTVCGAADPDYVAPETPKMPAEFVLSLYQANLGKTLYFKGTMSGYYFATTENSAEAVKVYSEAVDGGYRMYFMDGETKTYLDIVYRDKNKANVVLTTDPVGVYVWNADANTWTVTIDEAEATFYLGTYNSYNTISASSVYYITGGNAANIGVSQFVAQWSDIPADHEHSYEAVVTDPTCTEGGYTTYTCECGHSYVADEIPAAGHNFVDGTCGICGAADPDYVDPDAPVVPGGSADFNTITTTQSSGGDSGYTKTYTTENGWTTVNSAIQVGGASVSNPAFPVIGADQSFKAVCLNGKTTAPGKLTSPTLTGGISKLSLTYTKMFTDTKLSVTITITDLATGATYTHTVARDVEKDADKYVVWADEWVLETPITGDFTIEVVNDCPSGNTGNKDRFTILSLSWEGAAADEPDEPTANEFTVTTTDTYGYFDAYTFTADAAGTYTFTLPAGLGLITEDAYNNWGTPVIDFYENAEGYTFSVALAAGEEYKYLVGALTKDDWTITYTFEEGEVGGGDEPDPDEPDVEDVVIVVGQNTINVTDAMYNEGGFNATFTVETEGEYHFSGDFLVRIYNGMGMQVGTGVAYLTPGTYDLQIVTAYLFGAGTYGLNVELVIPDEPNPDEPNPDEPEIPENPVIESLPFIYEIPAEGLTMDGVFYNYTAAEEITLIISKPEGIYVTPTATNSWDTDENGNYVLVVNAGETIVLNFWAMSTESTGSITVSAKAD